MTRFITTLTMILITGLTWVNGAWAGDAAKLNILGFTEDGKIFAFEQYGEQDGSGFPYAERFYINTGNDSFVAGTPIKIRLDDENASIEEARSQAKAASPIDDATMSMRNAHIVASREITEISEVYETFGADFYTRPIFPNPNPALTVLGRNLVSKAGEHCSFQEFTMGFELTLWSHDAPNKTKVFHRDKSVPKSRNCPMGYMHRHVITHFVEKKPPVMVVVIAVRSYGFEGPDHRYIAIAKPLPSFE